MTINKPILQIAGTIVKMILYSAIVAGIALLITAEARIHAGPDLFSEASWVEYLEVILLFLTTLVLITSGIKYSDQRSLTTLMAGMTTIAFIREFDFFLDARVFDGAWQTLALITFAITGILVYKTRNLLIPSIQSFINRPSFGYFLCSFLTIFIFSRLFGRKVLWYSVMGEDGFIRAVKNAAEEGTELFGYTLLILASIEFFLELRSWAKS